LVQLFGYLSLRDWAATGRQLAAAQSSIGGGEGVVRRHSGSMQAATSARPATPLQILSSSTVLQPGSVGAFTITPRQRVTAGGERACSFVCSLPQLCRRHRPPQLWQTPNKMACFCVYWSGRGRPTGRSGLEMARIAASARAAGGC